jgi:Peptidase family S41
MKIFQAIALAAFFPIAGIAADEEKSKPPTLREAVDALTDADLKELVQLLKDNYIKPESLGEEALSRATIQGLIERLEPGASLRPAPEPNIGEASPFKFEVINDTVGYARIGSLTPAHLTQLDATLADFAGKKISAFVLDLRATPAGSEFEQAAEVCKRFTPKGKVLFTVKKPNVREEQILTSKDDPKYTGLLVALVDSDTAGAAEIVAAVLRTHVRAMIIGQRTRGEAVEFAELPLPSGKLLRVAVAEAALPDSAPVFPGGVKPDIAVEVSPAANAAVLKVELENGVAPLVAESERSKMNEAALVAGRNPELEALQEAQARKGEKIVAPVRDVVLQRALDFITTITVYEKKPARAAR